MDGAWPVAFIVAGLLMAGAAITLARGVVGSVRREPDEHQEQDDATVAEHQEPLWWRRGVLWNDDMKEDE